MFKKKAKLLIIDDEEDISEFEKSFFEKRNFNVRTASTGLLGITMAQVLKPDIAIIDIHLTKGMDGIEALRRLLKAQPQCKYIMVTWDKEKALEAKKMGAVDYLIKPVELENLENTINKVAKSVNKK